ncbi:5,10-methylenetetrahydrofolate reductase [Gimesia panareensis]|uniref:Methylenetetrahydrofolate reductase n=1 Tax=Gimesia panareensis TaxID=2527978 RepID=A0A518FZ94_9PLAN|nr:methylenetetrahydrofolate reductase [NAD(P)H] [Gimesia panareensis]QDV21688.1 5,10-methylenetetrahydrofolate reductase [Gimesia panareensis]
MRISEIYRSGTFGLSVEIFPPKSESGDAELFRTLEDLVRYQPAFVSCTYGAGGSTSKRTIELCDIIQKQLQTTATAHFTCVGSTREQLLAWLQEAADVGISNIMALRGDPPKGEETFVPADGGLKYASELVTLIRENFPDMGIGVAGYPEVHPEALTPQADLENLKRKVDAGADAIYTQLFFNNQHFYRFQERCAQAGIDCPIIPGIMPITEFRRIQRIMSMCSSEFPADLVNRLEAAQDDLDDQFEIGVEYAINQCQELIDSGVPGMHFYVLNRSQACKRIFDALGWHEDQA